jgi:hypothetical protein
MLAYQGDTILAYEGDTILAYDEDAIEYGHMAYDGDTVGSGVFVRWCEHVS